MCISIQCIDCLKVDKVNHRVGSMHYHWWVFIYIIPKCYFESSGHAEYSQFCSLHQVVAFASILTRYLFFRHKKVWPYHFIRSTLTKGSIALSDGYLHNCVFLWKLWLKLASGERKSPAWNVHRSNTFSKQYTWSRTRYNGK